MERINRLFNSYVSGKQITAGRSSFGGAGLIVTNKADGRTAEVVVVSPFSKEISAFLFDLKDLFGDRIDFQNKFAFYPEIGRRILAVDEQNDLKAVLKAMADYANEFAEQFTEEYFAYGSNMDVNQMSYRCPDAVLKGVGILKDYCFDLDSKGYATVRPLPGSSVQGLIWKVLKEDIVSLDRYEGVASNCYSKEYLPVLSGNDTKKMLVYVSKRNRFTGKLSSNDDYMNKVIKAAEEQGLDNAYIDSLRAFIS